MECRDKQRTFLSFWFTLYKSTQREAYIWRMNVTNNSFSANLTLYFLAVVKVHKYLNRYFNHILLSLKINHILCFDHLLLRRHWLFCLKTIGKSSWNKWSKQLIPTHQYVNNKEKLFITYIIVVLKQTSTF